ncbi:MAG: hypothetical protein ABW034_00040 [Steroidobacteraceae bacterium]
MNEAAAQTRSVSDAASEEFLSEEEKAALGTLTSELAIRAIDEGEPDKAKELIRRLVEETKGIHDSYLIWVTAMQGFIYREMGAEAFYRSQVDAFGQAMAPWASRPAGTTIRERVAETAYMLRTHAMPLRIEEDEEKVSLMMDGCGSGARLVQSDYYDPSKGGKGTLVSEKSRMTFGRENFPIYCTHCAIGQTMAFDAGADPNNLLQAIEPAAEIGKGLCKFHVYKQAGKFPRALLASLSHRPEPKAEPSA